MSLGAWLVVGFLAGWLANFVVGRGDGRNGCCLSIATGILGAVIGGVVMSLVTGRNYREFIDTFSPETVLVAFLGSVILLLLVRLATGARGRRY